MASSPNSGAAQEITPPAADAAGAGKPENKRGAVADRIARRAVEASKGGSDRPGRGRPPKVQPAGGVAPAAPAAGPLFTSENTDRLVRLPFTLGAIYTDCAAIELTDKEASELVASAVPAANGFVAVDPKWLALAVLGMSAATIVASKFVSLEVFKRAVAHENAERERVNRERGAGSAPVAPVVPPAAPFPLGPVDPGAAKG